MGSIKSERFRGVRQRQWGSWVSEIRHPITKIRVWLGSFHSAEEAAFAYDEAARFICGSDAKTNFPFNVYNTSSSGKKPCRYRLSPGLREKLRHCCCMDLSPTEHRVSKQSLCRNMIDSSRYAIFSNWNDLSETDINTTSTEEMEETLQVVVSDHVGANAIRINETKTFSDEEQLVPNHHYSHVANDSEQRDDYLGAEMINELLNCSFSFDMEFV